MNIQSLVSESQKHAINREEMNQLLLEVRQQATTFSNNKELLRKIFHCIDLTTLEGADTDKKVQFLCEQALRIPTLAENLPTVAAVCVYPSLVKTASEALKNSTISVASVAGGFPAGQTDLAVKTQEVRFAVQQGANEIDTVISRGKLIAGAYETVYSELKAIQEACGKAHLKVILETGELQTLENIRLAGDLAIAAGADFIKTSTGKIGIGATLEATYVMLCSIRDEYQNSNRKIGFKPAGGIHSNEEAIQYYLLVEKILGKEWLNSRLFRVGASSLAGKMLATILDEEKYLEFFKE